MALSYLGLEGASISLLGWGTVYTAPFFEHPDFFYNDKTKPLRPSRRTVPCGQRLNIRTWKGCLPG